MRGNNYKRKEIALQSAELQLDKEKQTLENSFNDAYFRFEQAVKNMDMAEKTLRRFEDYLAIIEEQYNAGLVSNNDYLAAELNMCRAKDDFLDSIVAYHLSKLLLQRVVGVELEVDCF